MPDPDSPLTPDPLGVTVPMRHTPTPTPVPNSKPSASHYVVELPLAADLNALMPQGGYIIEGFLGQGGMGAVYKGLQMPLRRPVAIKIFQKGTGAEFGFEERFRREAFAMAALTHPHIVQVYDCGDAGENFLFISMELVEGGDLSDAIKRGEMPPERALKLIPQICDALQFAHEHGIVHRDIKPANIFLTKDGRAKVADFGLAKNFDAQGTLLTQTGLGMGTPDYAAPEQYEGAKDLDHRADLYALGVMMYQMITGKLPRGMWQPPSKLVPVDPRLDDVVSRAIMSDREERWQQASEIKAAIAAIATPAPKTVARPASAVAEAPMQASAPRPATVPTRPPTPAPRAVAAPTRTPASPQKKSSGAGGIIAILCTLAALAAGAWMMLRPKQPAATTPVTTPVNPGARAIFDGKSFAGWHGYGQTTGPPTGWHLADGALIGEGQRKTLVTDELFGDFELTLEWRVGPGGNGGIVYHIDGPESGDRPPECPEMNLQDDALTANYQTGSLFGVNEATKAAAKPVGSWNTAKLVHRGDRVGHWVNDQLACAYDLKSSKFTAKTGSRGKIGLQGWLGEIAYRNVMLRSLDAGATSPAASTAPTVIDLLALVDVKRDAVVGDWTVTADGLELAAGLFGALEFPTAVPVEYDFEIEFTPKTGGNNVNQYLTALGNSFAWKLNAHARTPPLYGFELLDGKFCKDTTEARTEVSKALQVGTRHRSTIEVRRGSLRAFFDGVEIVKWTGDFSRFSMEDGTKLRDPKHLGVGSYKRGVVFHRAVLRPVVGAAQ